MPNLVKWITDAEMELCIVSKELIDKLKENGFKLYKHPMNRKRNNENSYYIRLNLKHKFSTGAYSFPKNETLELLCLKLHELEFVFWGTFKTEISPYDYMMNLQSNNVLKGNFNHLQAGEKDVKIEQYKNA